MTPEPDHITASVGPSPAAATVPRPGVQGATPGRRVANPCDCRRVVDLVTIAYEAIVDAADTGEPIDFETAGRPLADALRILRRPVAA